MEWAKQMDCKVVDLWFGQDGYDYPLQGDERVVCTGMQYYECVIHEGCRQVAPADIAAPTLFEADLASDELQSLAGPEDERKSTIRNREMIDSKIILQGAEDGIEDVRDGLGWTAAITLDTGVMTISASTDGAAFVIMGACRPLK